MYEKEFIIIIDHETNNTYIFNYDSTIYKEFCHFLDCISITHKLDLKEGKCDYMIGKGELNIKIM